MDAKQVLILIKTNGIYIFVSNKVRTEKKFNALTKFNCHLKVRYVIRKFKTRNQKMLTNNSESK